MDVKIRKGNGVVNFWIKTTTPMEWEIVKALLETADPIAMTKYLQDKGFVTQGDEVIDFLNEIEKEMEG